MAITIALYYPSIYLPGPFKESSGLTPISPLKRTQMITSRTQQRRAYTSTPTQTDLAWTFSDAQAQAFEAWFQDELSDEVTWLSIPSLTPVGLKNYVCRFTDIYKGPTPEGGSYRRYIASVELWERPLPPSGWGHYPERTVGSSLLDIALNKEQLKHNSD